MKDFNPPAIKCNHCKDIVQSGYRGEWKCCSCFKEQIGDKGIYIDSTDLYTRIGGSSYTVVDEGDEGKDE